MNKEEKMDTIISDSSNEPKNFEDLSEKYGRYSENYSPNNFYRKMSRIRKLIGQDAYRMILKLFHLLNDSDSPLSVGAKTSLIAVLGYLISPIDIIPDYIPVAGLADDIALLSLVMGFVHKVVSDKNYLNKIEERAQADMDDLQMGN